MESQPPVGKREIPTPLRQELKSQAMNAAESFANHGALTATLFFLGEAQLPEEERDRITLLAANVHAHKLGEVIHATSPDEKEQRRQALEAPEMNATKSIAQYLTSKQKSQTTSPGT